MTDRMDRIDAVAGALQRTFGAAPELVVVLGSGLGRFAAELGERSVVSTTEVGLPAPSVPGHRGEVIVGTSEGRRVACLSGRFHLYEGHDADVVALPVRAMARWGVRGLLLTSAVGGLRVETSPGQVVVISDHLNLLGANPLRGPNLDALGTRFPDVSALYTPRLRALAAQVARERGLRPVVEGVYAAMPGPSYETPAEVRMLATLGADVVGMSVVPEALAASHAGMEILALAVVANAAAGIGDTPLSHADVTAAMYTASVDVVSLLTGIIGRW